MLSKKFIYVEMILHKMNLHQFFLKTLRPGNFASGSGIVYISQDWSKYHKNSCKACADWGSWFTRATITTRMVKSIYCYQVTYQTTLVYALVKDLW